MRIITLFIFLAYSAAPAPSGGFYIVEPSTEIWGKLWHLMSNPVPGWGGDPPEYKCAQLHNYSFMLSASATFLAAIGITAICNLHDTYLEI